MNRYKYLDAQGEHVHLLDNQPLIGTSRVGSVLAKPLAWYGSGKAVEVFGCPNPKVLTRIKNKKATPEEISVHVYDMTRALRTIQKMDVKEFSGLIDKAYRAHDTYMRSRQKTGTDLHAECERFVKDHICGADTKQFEYDERITSFIDWTSSEVKRFLWSEGHCYSEKHWLGGISDAGYERNDGTFGIIDFKSSKEAYMDHFWQATGYVIQIEENGVFDADGNQLHDKPISPFDEVCIFPFGAEKPEPAFNTDMPGSKEAFLCELTLYKKMPKE